MIAVPWNITDPSSLFYMTQFPPQVQEVMGAAANEDSHDDEPRTA